MDPWNDWYHCTGCTYGVWVRGDPRGWRARHHREHVVGDYKHPPPPGMYEELERRSRELMKRPEMHLSPAARRVACDAFARALRFHEKEPIVICVDDHHFHVLARFRDHDPRKWIGIAKKEAARELSRRELVDPGGVWAIRSRAEPIKDRGHQLQVVRYIKGHERRGAAIWLLPRA